MGGGSGSGGGGSTRVVEREVVSFIHRGMGAHRAQLTPWCNVNHVGRAIVIGGQDDPVRGAEEEEARLCDELDGTRVRVRQVAVERGHQIIGLTPRERDLRTGDHRSYEGVIASMWCGTEDPHEM